MRSDRLYRNRKLRRERMLQKMARLRAAKERKRLAAPPPDYPPKFKRWYPLELGVRDKKTGEVAWVEFRSLRDAMRRLSVVLKHYEPGIASRV
jgi:hypothetical protein